MAFTLWALLEASLLVINAICVLNEQRFLAKGKHISMNNSIASCESVRMLPNVPVIFTGVQIIDYSMFLLDGHQIILEDLVSRRE